MSTIQRLEPVESLSAFDFNAPMEPVLAPNAPVQASSMLIPPPPKPAKLWPIFDSSNAKMKPIVQEQQWPVFNHIAPLKSVSRELQQPVFNFNAPMNPVTREWQQPVFGFNPPSVPAVQVQQQQPTLDLNTPKESVLRDHQPPAYIYNPPPPLPLPARGPVLPEVVSDDKEGCYLVKDKDWIYSSTIRIRPPVSALEFANDLSQPRGVGDTNNKFVVFTDGSAGRNSTATSAAIAYQRPLPSDDSPLWVARGFGIMGYAGGSNFAEFAAVSIALEAAVDMWNSLVTKENQLGPGAHPGPVPSWIKKLTPSPPAGRPKPRPPLPFSFIDLTGDDDHAVEVIDLTGDVSDNSDGLMIEIPPLVPPIVDKDRK
ncbi:hypothetical protein F5X68DRAFT_188256 [Plectosphaerella plurivora]|uniref:RNase H type-1 domain-containing protein n=1 Tax=Plectosphaerella plurivora TaxID=936078 RepID=A0A9P8VGN5_9PEZI|nr:hypothetical protein F5X68DRAFT_188256 [Plectosphaerella plurivora]